MNNTNDTICNTCQTSNGFSSAEQRALIVLVVLIFMILISCFTGVLWFGFRTRTLPAVCTNVNIGNPTYNNELFNGDIEDDDAEYMQTRDYREKPTTGR